MIERVFVVAQLSIHDRARYARYAARFVDVLAGSGGRLLAADDAPEVLSGAWPHDKLVLVEFADRAGFEQWAYSPAYMQISTDRIAATTGSAVLVTGVPRHAVVAPSPS